MFSNEINNKKQIVLSPVNFKKKPEIFSFRHDSRYICETSPDKNSMSETMVGPLSRHDKQSTLYEIMS